MIPKKLLKKHLSVFRHAKPAVLSVLASGRLGAMTHDRVWAIANEPVDHGPITVDYRSAAALVKNAPTEQIDLTKVASFIDPEAPLSCDWEGHSAISSGAFDYVVRAMSSDESRPWICAVHPSQLGAFGTDGHRLHLARGASLPFPIAAAAALVAARLGNLTVYRDADQLLLLGSDYHVQCSAYPHEGPPADKVLLPRPEDSLRCVGLDALIKRAPKAYDTITLAYIDREIQASGDHPEYGSFAYTFRPRDEIDHDLPTIGLNPRYLLDALTEDCRIAWDGPLGAMHIYTDTTEAVIMPVRL